MSKTSLFSFFVITLLSLLFRITYLSHIEFKADEAIVLFLAAKPVLSHSIAIGSIVSSVGIINPPLFVYLLSPFTYISVDPQFMSGVIGFLNAAAIGGFYLLLKKYYNQKIAVFTCLLLAFSPWMILFSRKIWVPDLILPLAIPLLYLFHKIVVDKKNSYWFAYTLLTALILQLHQSLIVFLLLLNIFLIFQKPKCNVRGIVLGLLIGFIPLIPYIQFEIRNNYIDFFSFLAINQRLINTHSTEVFMRPFQIMHQGDFFPLFGSDIIQFAREHSFLYKLRVLFYMEYIFLPFGLVLFWKKYKKMRMFVYSVTLLPIFYFIFRISPVMHYFVILVPFLFIFQATTFSYLFEKNTFLKYVSIFLFSTLIILSVSFDFAFFKFVQKNNGLKGSYGSGFLTTKQKMRTELSPFAGSKNYNEILLIKYIPENAVVDGTSLLLFDREQTKKDLPNLEKKMMVNPTDPRVEYEILAYYTAFPPTYGDVITLRRKNGKIPSYWYIYDRTYGIYLSNHLKQRYVNTNLNIGLEYPGHWKIEKNENEFTLFGDSANLTFLKQQPNFPPDFLRKENIDFIDQTVEKLTCVTKDTIWCGTSIGPLRFQNSVYFLSLKPTKDILISDKEFMRIIQNFDTIVTSFYYL